MKELRDTFLNELADIYDGEQQLLEALRKLAEATSEPDLKSAFEEHLTETKGQVERLKQMFEILAEKPKRKKCKGMQGLIAEAQELIDEQAGDAALICAAQKVEHYEIASYGSLLSWAGLMAMEGVTELLDETLEEEKATDEKLTELAESSVNIEESEGEAEEEEESSS